MKSKPTAETLANIAKFLYDCAKLTAAAAFITPHVVSTYIDNSIVLRFGASTVFLFLLGVCLDYKSAQWKEEEAVRQAKHKSKR